MCIAASICKSETKYPTVKVSFSLVQYEQKPLKLACCFASLAVNISFGGLARLYPNQPTWPIFVAPHGLHWNHASPQSQSGLIQLTDVVHIVYCRILLTTYISHRIHLWYIYANIGGILMVNVTIYSIDGSYGYRETMAFPHISHLC